MLKFCTIDPMPPEGGQLEKQGTENGSGTGMGKGMGMTQS